MGVCVVIQQIGGDCVGHTLRYLGAAGSVEVRDWVAPVPAAERGKRGPGPGNEGSRGRNRRCGHRGGPVDVSDEIALIIRWCIGCYDKTLYKA